MFLSRGDRDLGVAFQTHPGRQAFISSGQRVGIDTSDYQNEALLQKCIELYCKAEYDFAGKSEAFRKAYESTRDAISLCGDYSVQ